MVSGGKEKEQRQRKKPGRVPTSCAECRRLKLRCDRNVPCEKCVSRGCGSICPDGVLTPGRSGRLVLANTEELHDRIEQLSSRNRDLEKALRKLQGTVSDQPHPLLGADLLKLNFQHGSSSSGPSTSSSSKSPSTSRVSPTTHPPEPMDVTMDEDHNIIDAYGTLAINRRGESSFLGRTARADYLVQASTRPQRPPHQNFPRLSQRIVAASFPESELYNDALLSEILSLLPTQAEALHLCDVYLEYGKFLYAPISKKELHEETLNLVYRAKQFAGFDHYHSLSLLFIIFAIATLFSPNKQPFSVEADEYYHLSRAALGFAPPFHETTLTSIQAMIHMSQYIDLSDSEAGASDLIWMYMGQAVGLSQKIGLHLNSSRWKLSDALTERRHELFWRLFVSDTWKSLHFGRPSAISSAHVDCPRPLSLGSEGVPGSFYSWNLQFTHLLHSIMEATFGPKQPVYANILDFDRQIRDVEIPVQWRIQSEEESTSPSTDISMYRWLVVSAKEIALLNLHRPYFAQALQEALMTFNDIDTFLL
ncbi:fungal-specific transcription factor domain-containing protein [Gymnopilus junonius]|uniref:Fungal-specific transcription factor domain-containing protein n=1 Tax=Gymnopilus junonius TaxID=109634 RepID=A0A9P5NEW6_GYMJU|nr:fungal-specific transcription factor domain-containing protein [Gymnopilus junonius]